MFMRNLYNNAYRFFSGVDDVDEHYRTKLMSAVINGDVKQVELLVKQNASLDLQDYRGETALSLAIQLGHTEVAEYLIDQGAKLDTPGSYSRTPLVLACEARNVGLVEKLIEKKADVNIQTYDESGSSIDSKPKI